MAEKQSQKIGPLVGWRSIERLDGLFSDADRIDRISVKELQVWIVIGLMSQLLEIDKRDREKTEIGLEGCPAKLLLENGLHHRLGSCP